MFANMTDSMPYAATIAALSAWWISWREARRNNMIMVKLKRFHSYFSEDMKGTSYNLNIDILNCGIQMQNISLSLNFYGPGRSGTVHISSPLSKSSKEASSNFMRGTIASFILSSLDNNTSNIHRMLRDIKEQRPFINLYNNSFLACTFPIYSRWDRLKKSWNEWPFQLWNRLPHILKSRLPGGLRFKRKVGEGMDGKGVFIFYQLPHFEIRSEKLRFFLNGFPKTNINGIKQTSSLD